MEETIIHVFSTVGSPFCVEADDGQKIFNLIFKALKEGRKVKLSFQNVEMLTSSFLNTAIGQLYKGDFDERDLKNKLSVEEISPEDVALLKRVTNTAKLYYQNPERLEKSINEILEEK